MKQRIRELQKEAVERKRAEGERERLIRRLKDSLEEVDTLKRLIPICAICKQILDDEGYWQQIEKYVQAYSKAQISHSFCPDCAEKLSGVLSINW